MSDQRSDAERNEDFSKLSEPLKRASMDLREAIGELSAYYTMMSDAATPFEWLKAIDRCERAAIVVSERFAGLKLAVLQEPF